MKDKRSFGRGMCVAIILAFTSAPISTIAQNVYAPYEKSVNPFTGDLGWGTPLTTLTGSHGESFPISIGYSSNIGTNTPASWVGLGWNLDVGTINRQMLGFPDDDDSYTQHERYYKNGVEVTADYEKTIGVGPMHYTSFTQAADQTMDVMFSSFDEAGQILTPAFDKFHVSSPLLSNSFSLVQHEVPELVTGSETEYKKFFGSSPNEIKFKQFKSNGIDYKSADDANDATTNFASFQFENDPLSTYYIEYFTNADISKSNPDLKVQYDFIEYHDESGTAFDRSSLNTNMPNSIGAFTVVTPEGMKLYFSLPVLTKSVHSYYFPVDDNGNIELINEATHSIEKDDAFISSWKLTAITGPSYIDANSNGYPDDGDEGYWIRFSYSKWADDFEERTPYYDLNSGITAAEQKYFEDTERISQANVSITKKELYYIDAIETDIEKVVFFKDLRKDEFGDVSGNTLAHPQLLLKRVVRFWKDGLSISKNNSVTSQSSNFISPNTGTLATYRDKIYLEADYQAGSFASNILNHKSLTFDYSLAPKYYNNIDHFVAYASRSKINQANTTNDDIYSKPTISGTAGKLTLQEIQHFENGNVNIFDKHQFNYTGLNPDYHHDYFDYWGNYNPSVTNRNKLRFRSGQNPQNICSWLMDEIIYPNGTKLEVNYEPDRYKSYLQNSSPNPTTGMVIGKNMKIISINSSNSTAVVEVELFSDSDKELLESLAGRTVTFHSRIWTPCGSSVDYIYLYGTRFYSGSNSNLTFSNLTVNNKVTMTCHISNDGNSQYSLDPSCTSLPLNTNITNLNWVYFTSDDNTTYGGGSRVSDLRIYESALSSDYFKVDYTYHNGVATASPADVYMAPEGYGIGNRNTPFNALPSQVGYGKVELAHYGLDFSKKDRSEMEFKHVNKGNQNFFRGSLSVTSSADNLCVIDPNWINTISIKAIWRMMMENDSEKIENVPPLIQCVISSYVNDVIIAGNSNLSSSDYNNWQLIEAFIYGNPTIADVPFLKSTSTGHLYCTRSSVSCDDEKIVYPASTNYYNFYDPISDGGVRRVYNLLDESELFGQMIRLSTYDEDDNLILRDDYQYATKAKMTMRYANSFGKKADVDAGTKIRRNEVVHTKTYSYPRRKNIYNNGLRYYEEITAFHPNTGKVTESTYYNPTKGIDKIETTYLVDDNTYSAISSKSNLKLLYENMVGIDPEKATSATHDPSVRSNLIEIKWKEKKTLKGIDDKENIYLDQNALSSALNTEESTQAFSKTTDYRVYDSNSDKFIFENRDVYTAKHPALVEPSILSLDRNGTQFDLSEQKLVDERRLTLESFNHQTELRSAVRYVHDGRFPMAQVTNCSYMSFTCSGFETVEDGTPYFEGEVRGSSLRYKPTVSDITEAHTGEYVLRLTSSNDEAYFTTNTLGSPSQLMTGRHYLASVWVNNSSYTGTPQLKVEIDGTTDGGTTTYYQAYTKDINTSGNVVIGDWTLLEIVFEVPEAYVSDNPNSAVPGQAFEELRITLSNSGTCYFDDLRFHPVDVPLEVSVYDPKHGRVSHALDNNNMYEKYIYDAAGRVIETYREIPSGVFKSSENNYQN